VRDSVIIKSELNKHQRNREKGKKKKRKRKKKIPGLNAIKFQS
jgi:hypothetical protein